MKKWVGLATLLLSLVGILTFSQHQTGMVQAAASVQRIHIWIVPKRSAVVRQYSGAGTVRAKKPLVARRYFASRTGVLLVFGKSYYLPRLKSWVLARDVRRVARQGGHHLPPRRPRRPHMW
ncbi:MAG: hypothetical protein L0I02_02365 [Lactobacillus sp.]|nr:hypothetical protein [Lactobacillus sp.]MDN6052702.1 hypothetical protein [Lactobacillus sp.]